VDGLSIPIQIPSGVDNQCQIGVADRTEDLYCEVVLATTNHHAVESLAFNVDEVVEPHLRDTFIRVLGKEVDAHLGVHSKGARCLELKDQGSVQRGVRIEHSDESFPPACNFALFAQPGEQPEYHGTAIIGR
jgi:hypothetical protein